MGSTDPTREEEFEEPVTPRRKAGREPLAFVPNAAQVDTALLVLEVTRDYSKVGSLIEAASDTLKRYLGHDFSATTAPESHKGATNVHP